MTVSAPPESDAAWLEVDHPDQLDRVTTFFRLIWAMPILIVVGLLTATGNETIVTETGEQVQTTGGASPAACLARPC